MATILANTAAIVVPVLLPALSATRGLTELQGGLFAMAVNGGIGIGALGCGLFSGHIERLSWPRSAALGLLVVVIANLAMIVTQHFTAFLILALIAGIGAGLVNAVFYAMSSRGDGARIVAALMAAQIGFGALIVGIVSNVSNSFGDAGLFAAFAGLGLFALLLVPALPSHDVAPQISEGIDPAAVDRISSIGWFASLGLFVFFLGSGATYAFFGYMGLAWGSEPEAVDRAIAGALVVGMIGPLMAMLIGSRFGYVVPLTVLIAGGMVATILFLVVKPVAAFFPIASLLYFSINTAPAYLFDALTDIDRSTGAAMMMGASQLGGFAIGPAIAGSLVTKEYELVNGLVLALFAFSALLVFGAVWLHRRKNVSMTANSQIQPEVP